MIPCEEEIQIRDMARQFAQERLRPFATDWDREYHFPAEAIHEMAGLDFLGVLVPEERGGVQTGHLAYAMVLEEVAAGDGTCSTIMSVHNSVGYMLIHKFGSAEQKERFLRPLAWGSMLGAFALTEPQAGSDASFLKTRARRDGDHYVLNSTKQSITPGSHTGMVIVFAVTDPDAGKRGISAFIAPTDTPGYEVVRIEDRFNQHASDTCRLAFNDLRIPAALRLGKEGESYRIALANLEGGRISIAAQVVGMACAAFEAARDYAHKREAFGRPIIEYQAVAFRLADMATRIVVARQMIHHAASLREAGLPCLTEASMAKLFASEMAEKACSTAIQTLGGYGYLKDFPAERIYWDVRACQTYESTSDMQRLAIARSLWRRLSVASATAPSPFRERAR